MTKDEITEDVAATLNGLLERYDYWEYMGVVERKIRFFLKTDRAVVIAALEDWLDPKGVCWTDYGADAARIFELRELCPAIRKVRDEILAGRLYRPFYADTYTRVLRDLGCED